MIKRKLIRVTKHDIDTGRPNDSTACPIAIALHSCTQKNYVVSSSGIYLKGMRISVPVRVKEFISQFDTGRPVKPFNFYIKVPA